MALELVCRADFWCNRHCKTNPVDLDGFWGQVRPKICQTDLQIKIGNFRFPGVWHPREAAPRSSWGVASPKGRGCDVPGRPGRATGGFLVARGVLGLAARCPSERGTAQRGKRVCEIKAAGLYKFIGIWEASILGWVSKARTAQSATVPQHGGRVGRLSCANPAPEGPCTANLRYIK